MDLNNFALEDEKNEFAKYAHLPKQLRRFYENFKSVEAGYYDNTNYVGGMGFGLDDVQMGPVNITIDNTRVSVVDMDYSYSSPDKGMRFITLQGYAQLTLFDRFYASCVLIGKSDPTNVIGVLALLDHISRTDAEREELKKKNMDEVKLHPAFYASSYNDPVNEAESTCGIYIIDDREENKVTCDTVLQAIGIADFADNRAIGLAIGVSANINTFTNTMGFSVAASVRLADSKRFTIAGELELVNGKINAVGLATKTVIPIASGVNLTRMQLSVKGFQTSKISVKFGGGIALGEPIKVPEGLGILKKALFPSLKSFYPVELSASCALNPASSYFSLSGEGKFMGNFAVSCSVVYNNGDFDGVFSAGTVRNNYLSGNLTIDYHKRKDNWNLHGNFSCTVCIDWKNFIGLTVSGGVDILLNSQDYTKNNNTFRRQDLTITVSGMGKMKLGITMSVSVQKTWIFNLSNKQLTDTKMLMSSIGNGELLNSDNFNDVLVCESEDIAEIRIPQSRTFGDVIDVRSWKIDEQCSTTGIVKFQVAAQYTLADSAWRLTHSDGDTKTVYTAENAAGIVSLQKFTHNYYELLVENPDAGNWTLEILGDSGNCGELYMDALQDQKIVSELEILEQSKSAIRFRYAAYTGSGEDTTLIRLFAEEINDAPGEKPFSGVIAYLEETENGEFVWEIPEEFCHNAKYRFYIEAASSDAALPGKSNTVETFIASQKAMLDCSWELAYSADNTDIVTAYITITNSGLESTAVQWELLDYTNSEAIDTEDIQHGDTAPLADVIASGECAEIKGNSTVTLQHVISITDALRDNPSSLQLTVTPCTPDKSKDGTPGDSDEDETYAAAVDEITFAAIDSINCREETISWQEVDGADSYVLQYALEGDWDEGAVFVNDIEDTSYTINVTPGEYSYRVIALDDDGSAVGEWSDEKEFDIFFADEQTISAAEGSRTARSQIFALNDGIYDLGSSEAGDFTGSLTLYRNELRKTGENDDGLKVKPREKKILTMKFVNGKLVKPATDTLLDHGDYFWEISRSGKNSASDAEVTTSIVGEVFSEELADREYVIIGGDDSDVLLNNNGMHIDTLEGEVGFCNADTIYRYMTETGGEISLSVSAGTLLEARLKVYVYEQNEKNGKFKRIKTITVKAGEYDDDQVILEQLAIKNNFYIQVASWDKGKGRYNTDYCFDLNFDAFHDVEQTTDILEINGDSVQEWIGYRNPEDIYLMQVEADDLYSVRLQGDAKDAYLKICTGKGKVIKKLRLDADGTAFIDGIHLKKGNYFVIVESRDKGKGKYNTDYTLTASSLKHLNPAIDNSDDTWQKASLLEGNPDGAAIENWLGAGDAADFYKISLDPDNANSSYLAIDLDDKTARAVEDGILKFTCLNEAGKNLSFTELSPGLWGVKKPLAGAAVYIGASLEKSAASVDYALGISLFREVPC